jgi:hypothetical protein
MRRIIPFAFAVILVLAGGIYLFTSKIIKTPASLTQTTGVQNPAGQNISETSVPDRTVSPVPSAAVNQITLSVTSPVDKASVTTPSVTVKGTTLPGAEVSVNEKDVVANGSGNFTATIALEEGDNYIIVVAVDADGLVAEQELSVTYTPAE